MAIAAPPDAGTLTVEVTNVRNANGTVRVQVCDQRSFLQLDCHHTGIAPARPGTVLVTVSGLAAGQYAVQVFHDENRNGRIDRALFGIPKEGIGFSRDAPIRLGPPKWRDAEFTFDGNSGRASLKLRYYLGSSGPAVGR